MGSTLQSQSCKKKKRSETPLQSCPSTQCQWSSLYKSGATKNYIPDYFMPSTYSIWNSTTIILVDGNFDGNFNMVRGNFRHLDRSAAFTNTDSFNILERTTVTRQSLLSTTSLGKFLTCFEGPKALIHIDQHQLSRDLLILLLNVLLVIMIATA